MQNKAQVISVLQNSKAMDCTILPVTELSPTELCLEWQ